MALAYEIVPFLMTLSNLQCHLPIDSLLKCNFSYSYAATDKTSTELSVTHVVCLLQLSLLCHVPIYKLWPGTIKTKKYNGKQDGSQTHISVQITNLCNKNRSQNQF